MSATAGARIDCHIHSKYSPDGKGELHELAAVAKAKGLTGFFVTDHNSLRMAHDIRNTRLEGIVAFPGMEVSTREGHCLALGVREEVPAGLSLVETLERAEASGGIGVPSHPFRFTHGVGGASVRAALPRVKAIEVYNARDGRKRSNTRAQTIAKERDLGGTGGSDAHMIFEVGNAFARLRDPVETVDDVLDQIARGATWGEGVPTPRHRIMVQNAKNLVLWARRGFRGI